MIKTKLGSLIIFVLLLCLSTVGASSSSTSTSLYDVLNTQKTSVITYFNQVSDNVYDKYDKIGKPVVQTVVYKSLVCLGAISNPFDTTVIDSAKETLKKSILEEYIALDGKIKRYELGLLFDYTGIKLEILAFSGKYTPLINQFQTNQLQSISGLIQSVKDYTNQNAQLINTLSNNITKIENVNNGYDALISKINILQNGSMSGQSDFIKSMNNSKNISVNILNTNLQNQQDKILKRYKKLTGLDLILSEYKQTLLTSFSLDADNQINSLFSGYYDYVKFAQIKTDVTNFKKDFYSGANLICSNILSKYTASTETKLLNTQSRIDTLLSGINTSIGAISSSGLSDTFKQKALQNIKSFYSKRLNADLQVFRTFTYQKIDLLFNNLLNIPTTNIDTGNILPKINLTLPQGFSFTKPFTINEKSESVKILQQLLSNIGLYSGSIHGIYDTITKNAVYALQLKNGLMIGYENRPASRGRVGPATRKLLNTLIAN